MEEQQIYQNYSAYLKMGRCKSTGIPASRLDLKRLPKPPLCLDFRGLQLTRCWEVGPDQKDLSLRLDPDRPVSLPPPPFALCQHPSGSPLLAVALPWSQLSTD